MAGKPLALYVHIPFCTAKCTYCDFNSYAGQGSLMAPYAEAVALEASLWAPALAGRPVETVFFGGGTPSLLPLPEMATIVAALRRHFDIDAGAEVSLEANPGTVDAGHLRGLRELGFNRISFGVQSFHAEELRSLDRIHDAREVEDAYAWARAAGFENVNLDLIYGLEGQTLDGWRANLEKALSLAPEHLSLYALTLEEGTPLTRDVERGRNAGPDPDLQADMFEWSRERLAAAGYAQYEVSNWSRPGRECRHNLVYWRNGDWLGLGAGAHSHLFDERFAGAASPSRYIALVRQSAGIEGVAAEPDIIEMTGVLSRPSTGSGRTAEAAIATSAQLIEASTLPGHALRRFIHAHPEVLEGPPPSDQPVGARLALAQDAPLSTRGQSSGEAGDASSSIPAAMRQVTFREPADRAREMSETVILALRLREGLDVAAFERRFAVSLADAFAAPLQETLSLGLTELAAGRLRLRDEAVLLGDEAFLRFLPDYGTD